MLKLMGVALILCGAGYGGLRLRDYLANEGAKEHTAAAVAAAKAAWPKLARCLLGESSKDTPPSDQMRQQELALLAGAAAETPWPGRCRPALVATIEALERLEEPEAIASHQPLRHLLALERDASAGEEPTHTYLTTVGSEAPPIDRMVELATGLGLAGTATSTDLPDPPKPTAPVALPERPLGEAAGHPPRTDTTPTGQVRFTYGDEDSLALACRLSADGNALGCSAKDQTWTSQARPLAAESADGDLWIWDVQPSAGLVRPRNGDRASGPFGPHAFVRGDGAITGMTVPEDSEGVMLARFAPEAGRVETNKITPPDGATWLGQRADVAAWLGKGDPEGDASLRPLLVQSIAADGAVGEPTEVGPVPQAATSLIACQRGDWLALGLLSPLPEFGDGKDAKTTISVAFRGAERWHPPVGLEVALRRKRNSVDDRWRLRQSCREGAMALTWLREDGSFGQVRCTPKGCSEASSEPIEPNGNVEHLDFGALDGKILLATTRRAPSPLTARVRGVFVRLAPITELANAPDRVVIADELHGGIAKIHDKLNVVVSGGVGLLLVSGNDQLYAFRIDAEGNVVGLSPETL